MTVKRFKGKKHKPTRKKRKRDEEKDNSRSGKWKEMEAQ